MTIFYRALQIYFIVATVGSSLWILEAISDYIKGQKNHVIRSDKMFNTLLIPETIVIGHIFTVLFYIPMLVGFPGLVYFFFIFLYCQAKILKENIKNIEMKDDEEIIFTKFKKYAEHFSYLIQ